MTSASETPVLRDLWTTSASYRQLYQPADEIEAVVGLLEMEQATALADVGCGNGAFAIAAARANPACRVWAFDALQSAVDVCSDSAARELGEGRVITGVAPAERIPLPDGSVDRVLCRAVLHHLADAQRAYDEFARVLKPGGLLLLQAPCNYWQKEWGKIISALYMVFDDSHPRQYHQPGDVIAGLNAAGLAMSMARCWIYPWRDLKPAEVEFVKQHAAERRFQLRQESDETWSCDLYWLRVLATRI